MSTSTQEKTEKTTRWKDYYMRNRDKIKAANLARYYSKAGRTPPPPRAPPPPPVDDEAIKRLEALIAELRGIIPKAMKPPKVKKAVKAEEAATTPESVAKIEQN